MTRSAGRQADAKNEQAGGDGMRGRAGARASVGGGCAKAEGSWGTERGKRAAIYDGTDDCIDEEVEQRRKGGGWEGVVRPRQQAHALSQPLPGGLPGALSACLGRSPRGSWEAPFITGAD